MFARFLTLLLIFVLGTLFGWLVLPGILADREVTVATNEVEADRDTLETRLEELQAKVQALAERIGDGARELGSDAADAIQDIKGDAEEVGAETRERTEAAVDGAQDELREFRSEIDQRLDAIERALQSEPNDADAPAGTDADPASPATDSPAEEQPAN